MASINVSEKTHGDMHRLALKLQLDGVRTNIGDVTDRLSEFVLTRHADEFEAYMHEDNEA